MEGRSAKRPATSSSSDKPSLTGAATSMGTRMPPRQRLQLTKTARWHGHKARVFDMAWSPADAPQSMLLSAGEDRGLVWRLDAPEGTPPTELVGSDAQGTAEVMRCTWHPGGGHVLTGSAEGKITVWAANDGSPLASLQASSDGSEVYGLECLTKEGLLAAAVNDTVQQWDLHRGGKTAETQLATHTSGVCFGGRDRNPASQAYVFGLAARGRMLSAALSDGTVRLLDSQTLQELYLLDAHAKRGTYALGCALSPTSPQLATTAGDGAVLLWDLRAVTHGPFVELARHNGPVHAACFAPSGAFGATEVLVTGGADCMLRLTEANNGSSLGGVKLSSPVLCAEVSSCGRRIASAGGSGGMISDYGLSIWEQDKSESSGSGSSSNVMGPPPPPSPVATPPQLAPAAEVEPNPALEPVAEAEGEAEAEAVAAEPAEPLSDGEKPADATTTDEWVAAEAAASAGDAGAAQ